MLITMKLVILKVKKLVVHMFSHNCARAKLDSYDSLPLQKTLTLVMF